MKCRFVAGVFPLLASLALHACGGGAEPAAVPASSEAPVPEVRRDLPNVLLVTLDTTRADRIGAYGYALAKTENLDALAARGRRYTRAYSTLPLTIPAHASIFTSQYPPTHGIRSNGEGVLPESAITLAERMSEAGYHTGASVAAFVTTRAWGFDQGFESYFDDIPETVDFWHGERPGSDVVDDLVAWKNALPADGRPIFAWAHLYDAHFPYLPPEPWKSEQEGRPYDGEIAYLDDQVGRLLEAFADRETLIVVVGDHGEGLGQHGELTHGLFAYDSTQRVPYLMAGPGVAPGVIDEPVSLVDVAPTILSTLGLPQLPAAEGRVAPGDPATPVYMESWQLAQRFGIAPHIAVVDGDHKFIDVPRPELYDVSGKDPVEKANLADTLQERRAALNAVLDGFGFGPPVASPDHGTSREVAAQLQALGYVEGTFTGDISGPLPDPKDRADLIRLVQQLERFATEGNQAELAPIVEELATTYPEVNEFVVRYVNLLSRRGEHDKALTLLDGAMSRDPSNAVLGHAKATLLTQMRRFEEASILFQEAAEAMPYVPRVRAMAVASLLESPDGSNKAIELALTYMRQYPDDAHVAGLVGVELVRRGQLARGLEMLEIGILADRPERDVAMHLAAARQGQGRVEEARTLLQQEVRHHPGNRPAVFALLRIHGLLGDWDAQVRLADEILAPRSPAPQGQRTASARTLPSLGTDLEAEVRHLRAQALFNLKRYGEARSALDAGLAVKPEYSMLLLLDANLLKQEGFPDQAQAAFERAKAAKAREDQAAKAMRMGPIGPSPSNPLPTTP